MRTTPKTIAARSSSMMREPAAPPRWPPNMEPIRAPMPRPASMPPQRCMKLGRGAGVGVTPGAGVGAAREGAGAAAGASRGVSRIVGAGRWRPRLPPPPKRRAASASTAARPRQRVRTRNAIDFFMSFLEEAFGNPKIRMMPQISRCVGIVPLLARLDGAAVGLRPLRLHQQHDDVRMALAHAGLEPLDRELDGIAVEPVVEMQAQGGDHLQG